MQDPVLKAYVAHYKGNCYAMRGARERAERSYRTAASLYAGLQEAARANIEVAGQVIEIMRADPKLKTQLKNNLAQDSLLETSAIEGPLAGRLEEETRNEKIGIILPKRELLLSKKIGMQAKGRLALEGASWGRIVLIKEGVCCRADGRLRFDSFPASRENGSLWLLWFFLGVNLTHWESGNCIPFDQLPGMRRLEAQHDIALGNATLN